MLLWVRSEGLYTDLRTPVEYFPEDLDIAQRLRFTEYRSLQHGNMEMFLQLL